MTIIDKWLARAGRRDDNNVSSQTLAGADHDDLLSIFRSDFQ
jgi:hypothetical protein